MKRLGMWMAWRMGAVVMLVVLTGCSGNRPGIHQVGNWGPAMMYEDGTLVTLYTAQIEEYRGLRFFGSGESRGSAILKEGRETWVHGNYDETGLMQLWLYAPDWRREEKLIAVA